MTEQERIARALEMTREKPDTTARDMAVRTQALDMAVKSLCGLVYDEEGKVQYSEIEIVKAATAFENFIKGIKDKPEPNEHKKEGW